MKTTAYVRDKDTEEYKWDKDGNLLVVRVDEALNIRDHTDRDRRKIHKFRNYMSRNPNPEKRVVMDPKNSESQHFAFRGGRKTTGDRSYDETFSHEATIDVLSSMKEMKVSANGERYHFYFTHVFREPPLKLLSGKLFYPDVWCLFDEERNPDEYKKWGGKLAIEVTNTHPCEKDKLEEFELSHIPVFELVIMASRKYPPDRDGWRKDTFAERDGHTKRLKHWFEEEIWMDLKVDPILSSRHEEICKKLEVKTKEIESIQSKLEHKHIEQQRLVKIYSHQQKTLDVLSADNQKMRTDISNKEKEILEKGQALIEREAMINQKQRSFVLLLTTLFFLLSVGSVFLFSENLIIAAQKVKTIYSN